MITINKARKLLGKTGKNYSDKEIEYLINQFAGIAEVITQIIGSKNTIMGIEPTEKKEDYGIS